MISPCTCEYTTSKLSGNFHWVSGSSFCLRKNLLQGKIIKLTYHEIVILNMQLQNASFHFGFEQFLYGHFKLAVTTYMYMYIVYRDFFSMWSLDFTTHQGPSSIVLYRKSLWTETLKTTINLQCKPPQQTTSAIDTLNSLLVHFGHYSWHFLSGFVVPDQLRVLLVVWNQRGSFNWTRELKQV